MSAHPTSSYDTLELKYNKHPIKAALVDDVPWYYLSDIIAALGWSPAAVKVVEGEDFPSWSRLYAAGDPQGEVLVSPVGVFIWGALIDGPKSQGVTAWARRESRRICPHPSPDDPAMFLEPIAREGGTWALPPKATRYSGWKAEREALVSSEGWRLVTGNGAEYQGSTTQVYPYPSGEETPAYDFFGPRTGNRWDLTRHV